MSDSRESSPDWLRSFQVPTGSPVTLSSGSDSLQDGSASTGDKNDHDDSYLESPKLPEINKAKTTSLDKTRAESSYTRTLKAKSVKTYDRPLARRKKSENQTKEGDEGIKKILDDENFDQHIKHKESIHSVWTLSSDSESCHDHSPKRDDHIGLEETTELQKSEFQVERDHENEILLGNDKKSPSKLSSKEKSSEKHIDLEDYTPLKRKKAKGTPKEKGNGGNVNVKEEQTSEKNIEPNVSSSRLPLMLSEKVNRTKALIECEGDSIDLSGDMGAVGRVIISDTPSGDQEMYLDLKGTIYKTSIVPSRTFCIVSFGQSEAKIEAIMNDFIQLKPQSNVYEAETMVEGTWDGFSFDSDEEADKLPKGNPHQTDQNEHVDEQTNGKAKGKIDKNLGVAKKRGRSTGGKAQPPKKIRRKSQGSKKAKTKK